MRVALNRLSIFRFSLTTKIPKAKGDIEKP